MSEFVMVKRELLEGFASFLSDAFDGGLEGILQEDCENYLGDLRSVLAQEAGPGEPVAIVAGSSVQWLPGAGKIPDRSPLYASPPPQHPILKVLNDPQAMEFVALKATVAQQAQMIEYLKAQCKGEPVAWGTMQNGWPDDQRTLITHKAEADAYNDQCYELTPLYALQPSPVAMVLPDREDFEKLYPLDDAAEFVTADDIRNPTDHDTYMWISDHSERWEVHYLGDLFRAWCAAIDKVKELNQC